MGLISIVPFYASFFFHCWWETSSSCMAIECPYCLEGHSTTLNLGNSSSSSNWHNPVEQLSDVELLLRSIGATDRLGRQQVSAMESLKRLDTRSAGKLTWLADRIVRKSRCYKNNPSWKKLSLPPMKLLCVQLPTMYFAVQGQSGRSFTYVLTYLYLAVCNISTELDLKYGRVVQLEMIRGYFAWLVCLCSPFSFLFLVEILKAK